MSAKRILDLITLSQAVSAVGRRAILVHGLSSPTHSVTNKPSLEKGIDAKEGTRSEPNLREQSHSSAQHGSNELVQGLDLSSATDALKNHVKTTSQHLTFEQDTGNSSTGTGPASASLLASHGSSGILQTDKQKQSTSRTSVNYSYQPNVQDGNPNAEAIPTADQDPELVFSDLFHSPRAASMLGSKTKRPSAWSNIEFRTIPGPSQTGSGLDSRSHSPRAHEQGIGQSATSISEAATSGSPVEPGPIPPAFEHQRVAQTQPPHIKTSKPSREVLDVDQKSPASTSSPYEMRESRVPSTRIGRIWQYGGLATSLAFGTAGEGIRRAFGRTDQNSRSLLLSDSNMEILVSKLSRMRGAALKLGQMISFQDLKMLPAPVHEVLQRVQDNADFMPAWQRNRVLQDNLGSDWRDMFADFEEKPIAAASIGQVHAATLKANGDSVAVKIQYPGVADSIDSDLNNLALLLTASRLLPKGLYLDKTIANARTELAWECDYVREGAAARHFAELLADDIETFTVPRFIDSASGPQVLTLERMHGKAVTKLPDLSQDERNWIATNILRLCLRELFEFRYMQTDPNWTNFLFNQETKKLELLDFGASREYPATFTDPYCRILLSAAEGDRQTIVDLSVQLGYLTGHESRTMRDAHVDSVLTLAEPFANSGPELYDFQDQTITDRVRSLIPIMLRERLAPPPEETYSLHRKLSGAFLLCARLGSRVAAKDLFSSAVHKWKPVDSL